VYRLDIGGAHERLEHWARQLRDEPGIELEGEVELALAWMTVRNPRRMRSSSRLVVASRASSISAARPDTRAARALRLGSKRASKRPIKARAMSACPARQSST
jgi:hypothetical protein